MSIIPNTDRHLLLEWPAGETRIVTYREYADVWKYEPLIRMSYLRKITESRANSSGSYPYLPREVRLQRTEKSCKLIRERRQGRWPAQQYLHTQHIAASPLSAHERWVRELAGDSMPLWATLPKWDIKAIHGALDAIVTTRGCYITWSQSLYSLTAIQALMAFAVVQWKSGRFVWQDPVDALQQYRRLTTPLTDVVAGGRVTIDGWGKQPPLIGLDIDRPFESFRQRLELDDLIGYVTLEGLQLRAALDGYVCTVQAGVLHITPAEDAVVRPLIAAELAQIHTFFAPED